MRGGRNKSLKIGLPKELRERIDAAAAMNSCSVAEEIRIRLEASFEFDRDPHDRVVMDALRTLLAFIAAAPGRGSG